MLFDIPGAPDRIMMRSVVAHEVSDVSERTTITLDDDVAGLIAHEVRRTGKAKKAVVNDAVRRGIDDPDRRQPSACTPTTRNPSSTLRRRRGCSPF
jgi:Arc/MetJ family transcription regulator